MTFDISTFDVVQITYDEPNADALWSANLDQIPRLRRVSGVRGIHAAYKAAARLTDSSHLVTIDGDNLVTQPIWLNRPFAVPVELSDCVVVFRAVNVVNGLTYENGGIKIWPREVVLGLRSHEIVVPDPMASGALPDGIVALPDQGTRLRFYHAGEILSQSHINASAAQAFRAGYREGFKLTLDPDRQRPAGIVTAHLRGRERREAIARHIWPSQQERLRIWCSIGADMPNGRWAMLGARLGALKGLGDDPAAAKIGDFEWFAREWEQSYAGWGASDERFERALAGAGRELADVTGYDIVTLDPDASRFAKSIYRNRQIHGLVVSDRRLVPA